MSVDMFLEARQLIARRKSIPLHQSSYDNEASALEVMWLIPACACDSCVACFLSCQVDMIVLYDVMRSIVVRSNRSRMDVISIRDSHPGCHPLVRYGIT